jgi:CheY-like chemotaxis protein/DNA-binding XRE family transcriptional regulator
MLPQSIMALLGASVRRLRFRLDLSQEELAERSGLHRTYIAGIESGRRNVTLKSVDKLAGALKVSTAELLSAPTPAAPKPAAPAPGAPPWQRLASSLVDILYVEDSPDDVELTLAAFRQFRIANRIRVVHDGAEALDFLFCGGVYADRANERQPQIILLDLNLPKVPGLEVLRRVKREPRTQTIPVIVLTASRSSQDIYESRRLGAENYIVKPVDFQNFSLITPQLHFDWGLLRPAMQARARL